jgi:gliding motility-associated-like protein
MLIGSHTSILVSNASFTGDDGQLASFTNTVGSFPVSKGIALTTGFASFAASKNTSNGGDQSPITEQNIFDTDLNSIQAGSQKGTCFLEFDAQFEGQTFSLNYSFASDEYNYYSGSSYHDQMCIFIHGPGISSIQNIAKIGTDNVSVHTVNGCLNQTYYQNNCRRNPNSSSGGQQCAGDCGVSTLQDFDIPYNGFTKRMTATYTLPTCNKNIIYHIKIAICNIIDNQRDSGVFLEANSLGCDIEVGELYAAPNPVCNGQTLTVGATFTYNPVHTVLTTWNTGQTGSYINVIANFNNPTYVATITYNTCVFTRAITVAVHTDHNIPPYTNGVNNSGDFDIYIPANQSSCVYIPSFDTPNENVTINSTNIPAGSNFYSDNSTQEIGQFCWAPSMGQEGTYNFDVLTSDNNACGILTNSNQYSVHTICKNCLVDVYYENRAPGANPLPLFTKAGRSIIAGYSVDPNQTDGDVYASGANTTEFKAGKQIILAAGFHSSPMFWAHIDPTTCINDCNDCCNNFTGVYTEPIANVFTPDGDGINDVWMVNDFKNPNCAYGANKFHLYIYNRYGTLVYQHDGGDGTTCCLFTSAPHPNPNHLTSSIYWDGYANQNASYAWYDLNHVNVSAGTKQDDGAYFYTLELSGCNQTKNYVGFIEIIGSGVNRIAKDTTQLKKENVNSISNNHPIIASDRGSETNSFNTNQTNQLLKLFPNPASNQVSGLFEISSTSDETKLTITIENILGTTVKTQTMQANQITELDIKNLPTGTYLVKTIYNFNTFKTNLVIIQ